MKNIFLTAAEDLKKAEENGTCITCWGYSPIEPIKQPESISPEDRLKQEEVDNVQTNGRADQIE